jgi:uncharacterized protein (TIGR02246 family)
MNKSLKLSSAHLRTCWRVTAIAGCALLAANLHGQTTDTKAEADKLRALDVEWAAAAAAKDVDKTVSYYADDAVVFAPNTPAVSTREAIRARWKEMLTTPGATLSWKLNKVEVAKSGDLAYLTGTYEDTMNDAGGKPVKDTGNYVAIFKKQADGNWKCVVDTWNSDQPQK